MAMSRRGVVFTLMALILVAFIIATQRAALPQVTVSTSDTLAAQSRVSAMNSYLSTFEAHAANSLATAGFYALKNASRKVGADRQFIGNINTTLRRCILQGNITMGGAEHQCLSTRQRLNYSLDQLTLIAATNMSIGTQYELHDLWITEERPAQVVFWMNMSYNITDLMGLPFAGWSVRGRIIRAEVEVTGIEDPLYEYLRANGNTTEQRNFSLSPLKSFQLNTTTFGQFYGNRSYLIVEGMAPSVLQRYAGNVTSTSACCGIESLLARAALQNVDASYMNLSMVDHQFVAHKQGKLPPFNCTSVAVKAHAVSGGRLVIETDRFDNRYHLTSAEAMPRCQIP